MSMYISYLLLSLLFQSKQLKNNVRLCVPHSYIHPFQPKPTHSETSHAKTSSVCNECMCMCAVWLCESVYVWSSTHRTLPNRPNTIPVPDCQTIRQTDSASTRRRTNTYKYKQTHMHIMIMYEPNIPHHPLLDDPTTSLTTPLPQPGLARQTELCGLRRCGSEERRWEWRWRRRAAEGRRRVDTTRARRYGSVAEGIPKRYRLAFASRLLGSRIRRSAFGSSLLVVYIGSIFFRTLFSLPLISCSRSQCLISAQRQLIPIAILDLSSINKNSSLPFWSDGPAPATNPKTDPRPARTRSLKQRCLASYGKSVCIWKKKIDKKFDESRKDWI